MNMEVMKQQINNQAAMIQELKACVQEWEVRYRQEQREKRALQTKLTTLKRLLEEV